MPYINQHDRSIAKITPRNAGELNFAITKLCADYVLRNGLHYANINDVIGALEGAKAEFYRRVVAPYEDTKIAENGEVYSMYLLTKEKTP